MKLKKYISLFAGITFSAISISCVQKDDWNTPPIQCENKFPAPNISMADFKAQAPSSGYVFISQDQIFDGYVVSSDENGNFNKTISFQDKPENPTAALQIEVNKSSNYADFPVGAHIRINAKGLRIGTDRGVVKLGSVDDTYSIGRIPSSLVGRYISGVCNGNGLEVAVIKPVVLADLATAKKEQYINMLVQIPNVQFTLGDLYPVNKTFINYQAGAGVDTERNLEDGVGGFVSLRNSGFFAEGSKLLPKTNGDITFVVSRYNSTWQMIIRSANDVNFRNNRIDAFPPKGGTDIKYLSNFMETFDSYVGTNLETFPQYINDPVLGNRYWQLKTYSNNKYIQLGANAGSGSYLTYFAVPVNFTNATSLKFDVNVGYFNGKVLKVYTTTDYLPLGDIINATLKDITPSFTISTTPTNSYGTFSSAGEHIFDSSLTGNGFVLFEYSGSSGGITTSIQLDNIQIQ